MREQDFENPLSSGIVKAPVGRLVPQPEIICLHRQRGQRNHYIARWRLGQGSCFDGHGAAAPEHKAHPARFAQMKCRGLQFIARGVAIKCKSEHSGAGFQAQQMQFEPRNTLDRIECHRFDQVEAPGARDKRALGKTLRPFVARVRIGNDARSKAEPRRPLVQTQRPDRDIERRANPACIDPPDAPGVNSARRVLDVGDCFHRADFRRAGDRPAGIDGADDVDGIMSFGKIARHCRCHLVDRRIGFHTEQVGHRDGPRPRNP